MTSSAPLFVTFEGGEGSGKTTQIARLAASLRARGRTVVLTREPGGSPGAEALRQILLAGGAHALGPEAEAILFAAARLDHVATLIRPALVRGEDVLCDRFHDSTTVYQGLNEAVDLRLLDRLEEITLDGLCPDLTIVLDLPAEEGLRRAAARRGESAPDRFEADAVEIHEARRNAFLAVAARHADRCRVVDAWLGPDEVATQIEAIVAERLGEEPVPGEGLAAEAIFG